MIEFQEIWTPLLIGPFLWLAGLAGMGSVAYVLLRQARVGHLKAFRWVLFISVVAATVFVVDCVCGGRPFEAAEPRQRLADVFLHRTIRLV
ncbi:MAG: hypothetical protein LM562_04280 [Pyrobaculum sp.]|nr:hypothetical protein [Pyrobaculum sp.]